VIGFRIFCGAEVSSALVVAGSMAAAFLI